MSFLNKIFGGKESQQTKFSGQPLTVLAPISGTVMPLEKLPDETFASGILGPGCGIEPKGDTVYAPFNGTVTQVAETKHAVGMMSDDGIEILIHVGVDTVEMGGKGFKALVKVDQKVPAGTPLLWVSLDEIRAANHPTATAILVTNGDDMAAVNFVASGEVEAGAPVLKIEK